MKEIRAYDGSIHSVECLGCLDKSSLGIPGLQPVFKDELFGIHQDFETPIPGFMVLESRRHVQRKREFTPHEYASYCVLELKLSRAMDNVLGIGDISTIQEDRSGHFHTWFFPNHPWMLELAKIKVDNIRSLMDYAISWRDASKYAQDNMRNEKTFKEIEEAVRLLKEELRK